MNLHEVKLKKRYLLQVLILALFILFAYHCITNQTKINCKPKRATLFRGEKLDLEITVFNKENFDISYNDNFFISYHIYDKSKKLLCFENRRYSIPLNIESDKQVNFTIPIYFKYEPGNYLIEFDIVKEGVFWGSKKGWKTDYIDLRLKPLVSEEFNKKYMKKFVKTKNRLINQEQYLLRVTLKNSEIYKGEELWGFSAGSGYPQLWIRDTATFLYYTKFFYPLDELKEIIELFVEKQREDGEIMGWIDINGNSDKNTVETDQESSFVLAAYEIGIKSPDWLKKKINDKKIITHLEKALEWVWNNKRDREYNLIYSGFTADWGDVEKSYPDQRAIKLSDKSTMVFSTYTQAKYIQALEKFINLLEITGKDSKIKKWYKRKETLMKQTKKILYLKDKGYFLIHIDPLSNKYLELEKDILAVGGNAEAIIAGLMNNNEIQKFLNVLDKRRKKYNLRTVSFTLIPPYPEGFFPHPALKHKWSYQNGGEWDWIGGRVILALYKNNFRNKAKKYLLEIIRKNLKNCNIFEWEDKNGIGKGSLFYTGAAGVLGKAIFKGFLNRKNEKNFY